MHLARYHFLRVHQVHAENQGQGYKKLGIAYQNLCYIFILCYCSYWLTLAKHIYYIPIPPPSAFSLPTMSNGNDAYHVATLAVAVAIVTLPSI